MIDPAGHQSAHGPQAADERVSRFEKILFNMMNHNIDYYTAIELFDFSGIDPVEAQLLVQRHVSRISVPCAQNFFRLAYEFSDDRYIHHFARTDPLHEVGERISRDKLLYVSVPSSGDLGNMSDGVIFNSASTGRFSGNLNKSGILVQAATSGRHFGSASSGLVVALTEPESYGTIVQNGGKIIRHHEVSDNLRAYCLNVIDVCGAGKDAVLDEFGDVPANTIRENIYGLACWRPEVPE